MSGEHITLKKVNKMYSERELLERILLETPGCNPFMIYAGLVDPVHWRFDFLEDTAPEGSRKELEEKLEEYGFGIISTLSIEGGVRFGVTTEDKTEFERTPGDPYP